MSINFSYFFLIPVIIYFLLTGLIFFGDQLVHAALKPFWGDEVFGLVTSIQNTTYGRLLIHGASGQSSPSPLDYIFSKILVDIRGLVDAFGLRHEVYFRLWANVISTFSALIVMFVFLWEIVRSRNERVVKFLQIGFLCFLPIAFYNTRYIFYFAAELRPYASWNAFWFLSLAMSLLGKKREKLLIFFLVCLVLTTTAALFQLAVMIIAYFVVEIIQNVSLKDSLKNLLRIFWAPVAVAIYYCFQIPPWSNQNFSEEWNGFLLLWLSRPDILAYMSIALLCCALKKENYSYMLAPLTFLLLYLAGPIIFLLTKWKGYFFTERQYIYYDLVYAVFLLTLIQCVPVYFQAIKDRKGKIFSMVIVLLIVGTVTLKPSFLKNFSNATYNAYHIMFPSV